jgi:hypothetical protein
MLLRGLNAYKNLHLAHTWIIVEAQLMLAAIVVHKDNDSSFLGSG